MDIGPESGRKPLRHGRGLRHACDFTPKRGSPERRYSPGHVIGTRTARICR
jgi:hypothetical protein